MNPEIGENSIERALKEALRRQSVPEGFAERLKARLDRQSKAELEKVRNPWWHVFQRPIVSGAVAAGVSLLLVIGGAYHRQAQRERAEGEAAKQQLMVALRIAGGKLQLAKAKVNQITADQNHNHAQKE